MDAGRLRRDEEDLGDLAVGAAVGDQAEDVAFPAGQAEGVEGVGGGCPCGGGKGEAGALGEEGDGVGEGDGAEVGGDRVSEAEELGGPVTSVVAAVG